MTAHTPGPWEQGEYKGDDEYWRTIHPEIADVHKGPDAVSNARLIAAAPELLEALTNLMRRLDAHLGGPTRSADWAEQQQARAAIAKASPAPAR